MVKNGYTVTRSNYTLKEFHKNAPNGQIYERDFMTTTNLSGWNDGVFAHGENNFKMAFNNAKTGSRAHKFGEYLKHTASGGETDTWTLSEGASQGQAGSEGEIVIKSDNTTLLSYAYYGSCTELIKSTVKHIIENFPAEAYSTDEETFITYEMIGVACCIGVPKWYVFNNPFEIDFFSSNINQSSVTNPLRHFQTSYSRYLITLNGEAEGCVDSFDNVCYNPDYCGMDGTWDKIISIDVDGTPAYVIRFTFNGEPYYITSRKNFRVRPSEEELEIFFNSLDDFEKLLLNRTSNPKYTATLDFPHETMRGIETYKKRFTWPVDDDWNLDISSVRYTEYINDLLTLADFYDSYRTDNLWRMMTHDSIKNMDITFSRSDSDEDSSDYNEGTTKVQGLLWAYGRLFDELKRYIDNVRATNKITYSQQGNLPDYFLSDTLGLSGWEVSSSVYTLDSNATIPSHESNEDYGVVDANVKFLNNLKINTRQIFSRKGTRYGIEMILGLFGYHSDEFKGTGEGDYSIDEQIAIATVKSVGTTHCSASDELAAEKYGAYRDSLETDAPEGVDYNTVERLPVSVFYYPRYVYDEIAANSNYSPVSMSSVPQFATESDPQMIKVGNKYYSKTEQLWKTIIPWFVAAEDMDGNPYFQMKGGWGKIAGGEYSETINYLSLSETIGGLKNLLPGNIHESKNGTICYVSDISDFSEYFGSTQPTNYFVLKNVENLDKIGGDGWLPVTEPAAKAHVEYLEKIIDEYRGNNPHVGFDNYDDGAEFFEYLKQIFKGSIEDEVFRDNAYDCTSGEIIPEIRNQGFNISEPAIDNKKCWYFYDKSQYDVDSLNQQKLYLMEDKGVATGISEDGTTIYGEGAGEGVIASEENIGDAYYILNEQTNKYEKYASDGKIWLKLDYKGDYLGVQMSYVEGFNYNGIKPSDVRGSNGGNSDNNTIYAEPSVVNRKNLIITFRTDSEPEQEYIKKTVMPYLMQVVPSTSILEIKFEN